MLHAKSPGAQPHDFFPEGGRVVLGGEGVVVVAGGGAVRASVALGVGGRFGGWAGAAAFSASKGAGTGAIGGGTGLGSSIAVTATAGSGGFEVPSCSTANTAPPRISTATTATATRIPPLDPARTRVGVCGVDHVSGGSHPAGVSWERTRICGTWFELAQYAHRTICIPMRTSRGAPHFAHSDNMTTSLHDHHGERGGPCRRRTMVPCYAACMGTDRYVLAGVSLLALVATAVACGTGESDSAFGTAAGAGGSSGTGSGAGAGSGGTTVPPDAYTPLDSGSLGEASPTDAETCSAVSQTAERFPVDMVIMMDKSGSMGETAGGTTQTKWQAVTAALTSFVQDPSSADLGVGIQFFPLPVSTSLPTCTSSIGCTGSSVCVMNPATNQGNCQALCPGSGMCGTADCVPTGNPVYPGYCSNDNCDFGAYRQLQVEIATLPGSASAILSAMQAQTPLGGTPTFSAITGAIQHAQDWAVQQPDHKVVVVLATDGLPTLCPVVQSAADEAHVIDLCKQAASDAANGAPSVLTFVIGLGAVGNLDSIAAAGGTDHAFIVDPAQDVAKQFADALAAIRGSVMTCEFKLPDPDADAGDIDYGKVNVQYTPGGGAQQTIFYVGNEADCDPDLGGWYYDTDPSQSAPTRIIMCPKTCESLQADPNAKVDIAIGCKSETPLK